MTELYNYIALGNGSSLQDKRPFYDIGRGRMFEYTPPYIEARLENLTLNELDFLQGLDTFLCSEVREDNDSAKIIVNFGKLKNVNTNFKIVNFEFETIIDFGQLEFGSSGEVRRIFNLAKMQIYRTHWAVLEGSASSVLEGIQKKFPRFRNEIRSYLDTIQTFIRNDELPPLNKNIVGEADSVEVFLSHLPPRDRDVSREYFFRGHEDASFELTPSVLRKRVDGGWVFLLNEERMLKELLIAHYDEFQGDLYCFDRLVRMQHYGLPTRLLDISSNPLVALFFACYGNGEESDADGEVIVFGINSESVKYYDSDTVSCISNLSNLTYTQKGQIDLTLNVRDFNSLDVTAKLVHQIRSEKGYFESKIQPNDIGSVVLREGKKNKYSDKIAGRRISFIWARRKATRDWN